MGLDRSPLLSTTTIVNSSSSTSSWIRNEEQLQQQARRSPHRHALCCERCPPFPRQPTAVTATPNGTHAAAATGGGHGDSVYHRKRPSHLIGAGSADCFPAPSPTNAAGAVEGRSPAPVSWHNNGSSSSPINSSSQCGTAGGGGGGGGSSCLHHRHGHQHQSTFLLGGGSSGAGGSNTSSSNGESSSSSNRRRRGATACGAAAKTVGLGFLLCLGLGLLTVGLRRRGSSGTPSASGLLGSGGATTAATMHRPSLSSPAPVPEEAGDGGLVALREDGRGRVAPAWSINEEEAAAAAATTTGAEAPSSSSQQASSSGGGGYDYSRSTTDVFGAPTSDDRAFTFTGPFAAIRGGLDYAFHRNYLPGRQRVQDAIVQKFLDADAEASASTSGGSSLAVSVSASGGRAGTGASLEDDSLAHVERAPEHVIGPDCRLASASGQGQGHTPGGHHTPKQWVVFTAGPMGAGKSHCLKWLARRGFFPLDDFVLVR